MALYSTIIQKQLVFDWSVEINCVPLNNAKNMTKSQQAQTTRSKAQFKPQVEQTKQINKRNLWMPPYSTIIEKQLVHNGLISGRKRSYKYQF